MARKSTTTKTINDDVARELEKALDIDLTLDDLEQGGITDLDIAASMEDLEAQIAKAADELVKEGRATAARPAPAAAAAATAPKAPAPKPAPAAAKPAEELRPAEPEASKARLAPFTPANDDRQKDYRSLLQAMNRRVPTTVYWAVALLSVLWIGGGLLLANMLYGPQIWQIRSAAALAASPQAIALARDAVTGALGVSSIAIPGLETAIFGAILIVFILFEPAGSHGRWVKIRTYFELFPFYRRDMFRRQRSYLRTERMR